MRSNARSRTCTEVLGADIEPFLVRRLLLDVGGYGRAAADGTIGPGVGERVAAARQRLAAAGCAVPPVEARTRYGWIRGDYGGLRGAARNRPVTWTDRLDRVLTHRVWGTLAFSWRVMFWSSSRSSPGPSR